MTREETINILTLIKASYPLWAKDLKEVDAKNMIVVWDKFLKEYTFDLVEASIMAMIKLSKWPPSINEVIEKCDFIASGCVSQMSGVEAWSYVRSAITNSAYNSKSEFEKLPKIIQSVLRTPQTLKNWSMVNLETIDSVEGSQFMRSFAQAVVNQKNYDALPVSVKDDVSKLTKGLSEQLTLEGRKNPNENE